VPGSPSSPSTPLHRPRGSHRSRWWLGLALIGCLTAACSDDTPGPPAPVDLPDRVEVFTPASAITALSVVEDMSEEVANRAIELADEIRRRDWEAARAWFTNDFAGHATSGLPVASDDALPLGATRTNWDVSAPAVVGPEDWLTSLGELMAPLGVVEAAVFKVKAATFEPGDEPRGRVRFKVTLQGRDGDGGARLITMWAFAEVVPVQGRWMLHRWELINLDALTRPSPVFTDVAVPAGVAHATGLFGKDGNSNFYWNGAAAGDIDGDGLWDLFVPSTDRSFLYRNQGDGSFTEVSEAWGLGRDRNGTGVVFFDYDNDGDADLVVGHVGWDRRDGTRGGDSMRLYRNDGDHFVDVTEASGLDGLHAAFSVVAGDFDGNGYTDVYVCSYNRMDAVYPESWFHAENGTPNALYMNQGDGTFREEAADRGADDSRWTFAAAAADWNADGHLDLYLANDYGDNAMLVNLGDGRFEDRAATLGLLDTGNGMATAWGDIDDDGHLDLYVANMSSTAGNRILRRLVTPDDEGTGELLLKMAAGNSIFHFDPDAGFERVPPSNGGVGASWAWSAAFLDIDLDGCQDIMVANGFLSGESAADT
jgi:hypothetical protein